MHAQDTQQDFFEKKDRISANAFLFLSEAWLLLRAKSLAMDCGESGPGCAELRDLLPERQTTKSFGVQALSGKLFPVVLVHMIPGKSHSLE